MKKYINTLVRCGYSPDKAYQICIDFTKNLSLLDLDWFVQAVVKRCG